MKLFTRTLFVRTILFALLLVCGAVPIKSSAQNALPNDSVDENFVIASLLVADPGEVLYSTVGHVTIRLQCPEHNLDYVFSYESEDASKKVLKFLAGKLKMGMFAIPTQDYLEIYRKENRGVKEYTLNLPIEVKRNLWRVCDEHVAEGPYLPYDYLTRGCAHSALNIISEALAPQLIEFNSWPETFSKTRRELTEIQMKEVPWTWSFMNFICNGSINDECSYYDKVIMPADLITVLSDATLNGVPIMDTDSKQILPAGLVNKAGWFTPLLVSLLVLGLTILCIALRKNYMDYTLLVLQSFLGVIILYMIFFSDLVCTEFNTLIIPFNLLPLVLWKWRRYWCLPYAIIIGFWIVCVLVWPHALTDTPYIVISIALMASYINMFVRRKKNDDCF